MLRPYEEYKKDIKHNSKHTIASYTKSIERFLEKMDVETLKQIQDVSSSDCRDYQDYLLETGLSKSSVNANTRPVRVFFNWMIGEEYLEKTPWKNVKRLKAEKKTPDFLTDAEVSAMVKKGCTRENDLIIFMLLRTLGLRRGELINLRLSDMNEQHITVRGKGNKQRTLMIPQETYDLLVVHTEKRIQKWGLEYDNILITQQGKPYSGEAIRLKIQSIGKRAGISPERIKQIHPHTLRHTFATNFVETSGMRQTQGALGHSKMATTEIYAHLKNTELDRAMTNQRPILGVL